VCTWGNGYGEYYPISKPAYPIGMSFSPYPSLWGKILPYPSHNRGIPHRGTGIRSPLTFLANVDNLNEKGMSKPTQCCFCNDDESISHLFFECAIIKVVWGFVGEYLGFDLGSSYISVASKWLQKEIFDFVNIISTVVLRGIWLTRNDFVFNKHVWLDVKYILRRIWKLTVTSQPLRT
jgi:hypothetical protein